MDSTLRNVWYAGVLTVVCAALLVWVNLRQSGALETPCLRASAHRLSVWCASMLVWPFVWLGLTQGCSRAAIVGLAWPYLVMFCDVNYAWRTDPAATQPLVRIDSSTVLSLTFALFGLVGAHANPRQARLFILPVIIFMCIVMPTTLGVSGRGQNEEDVDVWVTSIQRVALTWCVGIVLSGVLYEAL
jgi:hypothetical protein